MAMMSDGNPLYDKKYDAIENQDIVKPIKNYRFLVSMAYIDTIPMAEIQLRGSVTSGNKKDDIARATCPVMVSITILDMVNYFTKDVTFSIVKKDELLYIYQVIENYVRYWYHQINSSPFAADCVPLERITAIEEFYNALADHNDLPLMAIISHNKATKSFDSVFKEQFIRYEENTKNSTSKEMQALYKLDPLKYVGSIRPPEEYKLNRVPSINQLITGDEPEGLKESKDALREMLGV